MPLSHRLARAILLATIACTLVVLAYAPLP